MTTLVELIRRSKTSRARANDGNLLASAGLGGRWDHPAHLETTVDDGALDGLDADWVFVDAEDAGTLARGWADTASELGEVVSPIKSVSPTRRLQDSTYMSRRLSASRHWFWNTNSFHLGMMLARECQRELFHKDFEYAQMGQPVSDWQKGTPQSMQRAV